MSSSQNRTREWLALLFAMLFPTSMSWLYFIYFANEGAGPNQAVQLAFGIGKTIQFAFPVLYLWFVDRQALRWSTPTSRGLVMGVGFALLTVASLLVLYHTLLKSTTLLENVPIKVQGVVRQLNCDSPMRFLALAATVSIVHSLLEEYYFRWFIFGRLQHLIPLWPAIIISSMAFMAHHIIALSVYFPGQFWTLAIPFSLCTAVGGAVWAWMYHRSQSLLAIWISHLIVDVGIMIVGWDMLAPTWNQ